MTAATTSTPPWADLAAYRAEFRAWNPIPTGAPKALSERRQWLLWRYEPGETPEKKPRKMPYYADGGRRHSDQGSEKDRKRLATFEQARVVAAGGDWDGVGFAFLPAGDLIGIDLDGMIDGETGEVSDRLQGIVAACASYTELSPSGSGVHVICTLPQEVREAFETEHGRCTFKSNKVGVEVFADSQFFTFTGQAWGTPAGVVPISMATMRRLHVTVKGPKTSPPASPAVQQTPAPQPQQWGGRQRSMAETVALAEEALGFVAPDEYQTWIEVGMACHVGLGTVGYMVWDAWSARSPKYAGPEDTAKRWAGLKPEKVTLGTIFGLAEAGGWKSPWAKARERKTRSGPGKAASAPPPREEPAPPPLLPTEAPAGGGGMPPDMGGDAPELPEDDESWQELLIYRRHEVSPCLANAELILSNVPMWKGLIGYDEFSETTVFRDQLPVDKKGPASGPWTDLLDSSTAIWMQRAWGADFSPTTIGQAVEVVSRKNRFHPVREALEALPVWDGIARNASWMADFLEVEQSEYVALVGQFFLRGMVKRVYEPGCKFDYCLVLEGEQGRGKSTVARILAWNWFCDTDLDLSNKDSLLALPGHWVYEIAELGSLMKAEERKQKSFLSRQEDEYRPPYGKRLVKVPRQCVFIGTTNEFEYLKDATGGRRFWPVMCGNEFNLDGLRTALPQMLAEALHDYRERERCWPTPEEQQRLFTPEQAKRGMPEPFEDILYAWVDKQCAPFSMAEAAMDGLGLTADKLTPAVITRIGMALRKLGCDREEHRLAEDPSRRRLYVPPRLRAKRPTAAQKIAQSDNRAMSSSLENSPQNQGGANRAPF